MKRKGTLGVLAVLAVCALLPGFALAGASFDGTVVSRNAIAVPAPFGGVVESVEVREGDFVNAGDVLGTVMTTKVYAPSDGVVTGLFAQAGDSVANVVSRYGAALYITPANKYTVEADTSMAYGTNENMYVHLGEVVYLRSYNFQIYNTGMGVITAVADDKYTVETTQGEFWMGETVSIYRSADYDSTRRIGRGEVSRTAEIAVGDGGSIVALYVQNGDAVTRGQLLYETVTGDLEGLIADGNQIKASVSGIVETVDISAGASLAQGGLVATLCPMENMQIRMIVNEYDLMDIAVGEPVALTFTYDDLGAGEGLGTVEMISDISTATDTSDVSYAVYIDFAATGDTRLGMTVMVDLMDEAELEALEAQKESPDHTAADAAPAAEDNRPASETGDFTNLPSP